MTMPKRDYEWETIVFVFCFLAIFILSMSCITLDNYLNFPPYKD